MIKETLTFSDLVFYTAPTYSTSAFDPHRLHSEAESKEVDNRIPEILQTYAPSVYKNIKNLIGDVDFRSMKVIEEIMKVRY